MNKLFLVLGSKGNVSKKINTFLKKNGSFYFTIGWNEYVKYGLKYLLENQKFYNFLNKNNIKKNNIYIIDCFIGNFYSNEEASLHLNLIKITKQIFPESKFIYLSTYEPQLKKITYYRKMKSFLENKLTKNSSYIFRIGKPMLPEELEVSKLSNFNFDIKSFKNKNILVPFTNIAELISNIKYLSNEKINCCYSGYLFLSLNIYPEIKLNFLITKSRYKIYLPMHLIYSSCLFLVKILKLIRVPKQVIILLEKPISLIAQQSIIEKNDLD